MTRKTPANLCLVCGERKTTPFGPYLSAAESPMCRVCARQLAQIQGDELLELEEAEAQICRDIFRGHPGLVADAALED